MASKIINYGSINIDYVYRTTHFVQPGETLNAQSLNTGLGGKGANQSVAIARSGGQVLHVGQVCSSDSWALQMLQDSGVSTEYVIAVEEPSGHAIIQVDDCGENAILLFGGANQTCQLNVLEQALSDINDIDYLLLQNECNDIALAFELAIANNVKVALNPAPMSAAIGDLPLQKLDTLIVNEIEAAALTGESTNSAIIAHMQSNFPNTRVVITLGSKGSILLANDVIIEFDSIPVDAVDTTGAGDTFVGYFLQALVLGLDDLAALKQASSAAALAVTQPGAISAIPYRESVVEFINA